MTSYAFTLPILLDHGSLKKKLFPKTTITIYHKFSGLKQNKFILSKFWSLEVQNQVQQDYDPFKVSGEEPGLFHLLEGIVAAELQFMLPFSHSFLFLWLSLSSPPLIKTPVIAFQVHPNSVWSHLNWLHPRRSYFQRRSYSEVPDEHEFFSDTLNPVS